MKAIGIIAAWVLIGARAAVAHDVVNLGDSWNQDDRVGRNPVVHTAHDAFAFAGNGEVVVRSISGSVEVVAAKGDSLEFSYEQKAATQADADCVEFHAEHDKDHLRIWVDPKRVRECRSVHLADKLTLTVPRGADVSLESVGDSVAVTGLEGMLRLGSIGDTATLKDVQQLQAESIGDTLKLDVSRLGPKGIEIDSVGDSVLLSLPDRIDARMEIDSVGDEIRGPGLRVSGHKGFEAVLGKGGPRISIASVGDSVVIHGPDLQREGQRSRED